MSFKLQTLFPSLLLVDQLEDYFGPGDNDAIIKYCYDRYKQDTRQKFEGAWSSGHLSLDDLNSKPLAPLISLLNDRINEMRAVFGVRNDVEHTIKNFWANIFEPTGRYRIPAHPPHMHPNYFLSCVYYPQAQPRSGNIVFMSPFNDIERTFPFKQLSHNTIYNTSRWLIEPEPAKLIIFPAWLTHYVEDNNSDEDRISIAFNISLPSVDS